MYKVALIIPYFGQFPNYWSLWEYTASKNSNFDFFVFTDNCIKSKYINIKYIYCTLDEIRNKLMNILKFCPCLKSPYKIVDYKPMYGVIFENYIKGYTHWGYCDSDIIFGNLKHFINDETLQKYDRVYKHGHLTIYKNTLEINYRWKSNHNLISYIWKEVYKVNGVKMFDERGGMWDLWEENGWSEYVSEQDFADILPVHNDFITPYYTISYLKYSNGTLSGIIKEGKIEREKEFAYVHLQKRKMELTNFDFSNFFIKPNIFTDNINLNKEMTHHLMQCNKNNIYKRLLSCSRPDELLFHIKVALRRTVMFLKGENRKIHYKLY